MLADDVVANGLGHRRYVGTVDSMAPSRRVFVYNESTIRLAVSSADVLDLCKN
ncbi:MAG: hypothetical protein H0T68_15475 [Gemmatimonadales bacterium]|nr:hypothetical protein [Gemmatimonadales bacterium]